MILFFLRGEKESRASSSRRNQGRINREKKSMVTEPTFYSNSIRVSLAVLRLAR
jgi:hypothetical protein